MYRVMGYILDNHIQCASSHSICIILTTMIEISRPANESKAISDTKITPTQLLITIALSWQHAVNFLRPKNPTASAGIEPTILGTRGQHANH